VRWLVEIIARAVKESADDGLYAAAMTKGGEG
jgi:hypothetical protein